MRILYPCIRIHLHDRAHSNPLIQLFWLSFWLILGFTILEQPANAAILESKPDLAEFVTVSTDSPEETTPIKTPHEKADEHLTKHPETVATSVLGVPIESHTPSELLPTGISHSSVTKALPTKPAQSTADLGLAGTLGLRGNRLNSPPAIARESFGVDRSIESHIPSELLQSMGTSRRSVTKTLPTKPAESTVDLGLSGTLGLQGNRLHPLSAIAYEPIVVDLEAQPSAIAQSEEPLRLDETRAADTVPNAIAQSEEPLRLDETEAADPTVTEAADPTVTEDLVATESELLEPTEPLANYQPLLEFQAVSIYQDDDFSARLRATGIYALNEQVLFGAVVDLTTGDAFVDSDDEGLSLNELYVSAAPIQDLPNLRLVGGLVDFTSYFDRNSFAKDAATHFFNPVFQTNPALSAAGIASRPGLLVNWSATDHLELKAAAFSSTRDLGDFAIDGFAAEVGFRVENLIVRGTYATARDAGDDNGFAEIFQFQRDDGSFGLLDDDREVAYGINAEYFFESINLGVFGRYGWYENQDLDSEGTTFSLGLTALDVFLDGDRLGLAYGQRLSNSDLQSGDTPDVWELLYDAPIFTGVRAGVSLQSQDEFSDTFLGLRIRADW